jgi:lantibiotic biosynthesis protein
MSTIFPYRFLEQVVMRTPALPFVQHLTASDIDKLLQRVDFLEAIYLASPVLYKECIKCRDGLIKDDKEKQKIQTSIIKYYQRMYSRCTPFGLFSGCTVANWAEQDTIITIDTEKKERHTRLDMHYLCALVQHIAQHPSIKNRLLYYPNTSIYKTDDEIRYVEYRYTTGKRMYQISAVTVSDYLEDVLQAAKSGITISALLHLLQKDDITTTDAMDFIEELLQAQILTNALEPSITGEEFIYPLIAALQKINDPEEQTITTTIAIIKQIEEKLKILDVNAINAIEPYKEIITLIESLGVEYEESKLFQTDLVQTASTALLDKQHQEDLTTCVQLFNGLFTYKGNEQLESFARRFYERFEDREMPLLQVLDSETGIGYLETVGRNMNPLLDGVALAIPSNTQQSISWSAAQQWLFALLKKATVEKLYEVTILEEDIKNNVINWDDTPPSIAIMFRLINDGKLLVENIGGSSAANLLARFAHSNVSIKNLVQQITDAEQSINPEIIFAEIVHLPESRVGNVLLHPVFRSYEIPYLASSSLSKEQQINVEDLSISVQNGVIYLRSQKLQKIVIPRLSSAHNFGFNALPVYQFLGDLQTHQLRNSFAFYWGNLSNEFIFLPRVTYKNLVLKEATWQFAKKEMELLVKDLKQQKQDFINLHRLPCLLVLADGDNELLVDRESPVSVMAFIDAIKNRASIILKEFMGYDKTPIKDSSGQYFINQFITSLVKTIPTYTNKVNVSSSTDIERNFVPGTEWFYVKLYCGNKSADKILEVYIDSLLVALRKMDLIDHWFFIRYVDTHFHLRLRFHIKDHNNIGMVMYTCGKTFQQLQEQNLVWKVQIDTYNREIERYGNLLCIPSEKLFGIDSDLQLLFLKNTEGDEREHIRWLWGMKSIDWLLDSFAYTLEEKIQLMHQMRTTFAKEFNFQKFTLQSINKKYATHRKEIEAIFSREGIDSTIIPIPIFTHFTNALKETAIIIKESLVTSNTTLNSLMSSYIHMHLNRLFLSESRIQEAIIYEFLFKWYLSVQHRNS